MSQEPLVSIIIPTFNRAHLIGETLDSVLAQTYRNWECIVVDDGSTDDTDAVMQKYCEKDSRFKYYHRPDNYAKGANSCRHIGFLKSQGTYVNWFDSDDLMLPNHIFLKVEVIVKEKNDFVVCEVARWYQQKNNDKIIPIKNNYQINPVLGQFIGELTLFTCGPLWDRKFLIEKELFYKKDKNEMNDTVLNDWIFNLGALMQKPNFKFIKKVLIYYRFHESSIYADRRMKNVKKIYDELKIRIHLHNKCQLHLDSYSLEIDYFYAVKLLKLSRSLLYKGHKIPILVYIEFMKLKSISFLKKSKLILHLFFSNFTKKKIKSLRFYEN